MNREHRTGTKGSRKGGKRLYARLGVISVVVLTASSLVACGTPSGGAGEAAKKPTRSPVGNPSLTVGDTAVVERNGTELTVHSYESPLPSAESSERNPGFEFSAIEVEECASTSSGGNSMVVTPNAFILGLPGGARATPEVSTANLGLKKPVLQSMDPAPGDCERGYIIYQMPRGERPETVIFKDTLILARTIAWKVPDGGQ